MQQGRRGMTETDSFLCLLCNCVYALDMFFVLRVQSSVTIVFWLVNGNDFYPNKNSF